MTDYKEIVRYILHKVSFSCFVILFEVGYHVIVKDTRHVSYYLGQAIILCLALFVADMIMAWWSKRKQKK